MLEGSRAITFIHLHRTKLAIVKQQRKMSHDDPCSQCGLRLHYYFPSTEHCPQQGFLSLLAGPHHFRQCTDAQEFDKCSENFSFLQSFGQFGAAETFAHDDVNFHWEFLGVDQLALIELFSDGIMFRLLHLLRKAGNIVVLFKAEGGQGCDL